jgi:phosphoribosylglycinamide formyltransferase-1
MKLAVFASGGGSNFQAIVDAAASGRFSGEVVLCLSNRKAAGVLDRAQTAGIPTVVLSPRNFDDAAEYEDVLLATLSRYGVDFIALAGYLQKIPPKIVERFRGRIVNIHPALLPAFGGKGMYGIHVHEAVLAAGVSTSGATVHVVDEEYDTGPIVLQEAVAVEPGDTPETLAARVLEVEHRLYPAALALLAERVDQGDDGY